MEVPHACTQKAITIPASEDRKLRQDLYWRSREWITAYGRRSRVEGAVGVLKTTNGGLAVKHGWTRRVGLVQTAFLLGIAVAAQNLQPLPKWARDNNNVTTDSLPHIDISDNGFAELDANGVAITDLPPPPD